MCCDLQGMAYSMKSNTRVAHSQVFGYVPLQFTSLNYWQVRAPYLTVHCCEIIQDVSN